MDIIFGRKNAEKLREKYTVLDLEVVHKDGHEFEVFCLIPADKIPIKITKTSFIELDKLNFSEETLFAMIKIVFLDIKILL